MDHNKMNGRQARSAGVYDGWHEASFVLSYNRPSGSPVPEITDPKIAAQYAEGVELGRERHGADLEVNGRPIAQGAVAINARLRERNAAC